MEDLIKFLIGIIIIIVVIVIMICYELYEQQKFFGDPPEYNIENLLEFHMVRSSFTAVFYSITSIMFSSWLAWVFYTSSRKQITK